jgi:hypothetical protein
MAGSYTYRNKLLTSYPTWPFAACVLSSASHCFQVQIRFKVVNSFNKFHPLFVLYRDGIGSSSLYCSVELVSTPI